MKIVSIDPIFDFVNNGFTYLCTADDGTFWLRSTAGNWVQIKSSTPMDTDSVDADFQAFQESGKKVTEEDVKADNASQVIKDPEKKDADTADVAETI